MRCSSLTRVRLSSLLPALLALTVAPSAAAQQVYPREPQGDCIALLMRDAIPAVAEASWWLMAGGGVRLPGDGARDGLAVFGAGAEVTAGLAQRGPQAMYGGPVELRWGPWVSVLTDLHGARSEGGLLLSAGQVRHARWGTYALRLGGGLGEDGLGLSPHLVATLTGGVRYVKARYSERGACEPPKPPQADAFASGVRLFASARAALAPEHPWQLTFGIEIEPTFLLPPYSLTRWGGTD